MLNTSITESNINGYEHFDKLKETVDKAKAKQYFENLEGKSIPAFKVNMRVHKLLQDFILKGGFEI